MHKKYIERNDGIIVIDDEDKIIEYNNDDKIDEILKTENMVEILNDNKKMLEDEIEKRRTIINPKYNLLYLLIILIVTLPCQFLLPSTKIETAIGLMSFNNLMSLISVTVSVPFVSCVTYMFYKSDVKIIKEKKDLENALKYFEETLSSQQEKLNHLKQNVVEKEIEPIEVDTKDDLLKLKEALERYHENSHDEEKSYIKVKN